MPTVTIPGQTATPGYLAEPIRRAGDAESVKFPGVVMIQDLFGLGDDLRDQADWVAAAGYLTVAPDLYQGRAAVRCMQGTFRQLAAQRGPMFGMVEASRRWLAQRPDCTGEVGVIGYCSGGAFALLMAGRPGWTAAAVNYGQLPQNLDEVLSNPCPVVASFGGRDRSLPGAAATLADSLAKSGVPHDVKEYPDARHAFINRVTAASPLTTLLKVAGIGHDHPAAADAKRRILSFFDAHLRETQA